MYEAVSYRAHKWRVVGWCCVGGAVHSAIQCNGKIGITYYSIHFLMFSRESNFFTRSPEARGALCSCCWEILVQTVNSVVAATINNKIAEI